MTHQVHHVGWSVACVDNNPRFFHIEDALWWVVGGGWLAVDIGWAVGGG